MGFIIFILWFCFLLCAASCQAIAWYYRHKVEVADPDWPLWAKATAIAMLGGWCLITIVVLWISGL